MEGLVAAEKALVEAGKPAIKSIRGRLSRWAAAGCRVLLVQLRTGEMYVSRAYNLEAYKEQVGHDELGNAKERLAKVGTLVVKRAAVEQTEAKRLEESKRPALRVSQVAGDPLEARVSSVKDDALKRR